MYVLAWSDCRQKTVGKNQQGVLNFEFTIGAVRIFANLVKLKIEYADVFDPVDWERFCLNNLVHLRQLEELTLEYHGEYRRVVPFLPKNTAFPDELKKVTLSGTRISWETMSVISSLPYLEVLKLVICEFESGEWEPVEGEFERLKYLEFGVGNLKIWKVESFHFPCIEQLILDRCYDLKEVPAEVGEIESLQKLVIQDCKKHIGDSAMIIQEVQQSYGNYTPSPNCRLKEMGELYFYFHDK